MADPFFFNLKSSSKSPLERKARKSQKQIMNAKNSHTLMRWLCSLFFMSVAYADVALPTQQLKVIKVGGTIELNCESDQVFHELFKLFSAAQDKKSYYNIVSQKPTALPAIFFAWNNVPEERYSKGKLVLEDPTLWELLESVCKKRGRRLIDLSYGVAFLEGDVDILKISEVVRKLEATGETRQTLEMFAPSQVQLTDVANSGEVVEFINGLLKQTGSALHSSHVLQIEADEAVSSEAKNNQRKRATFMGYWRYVDLLHVYGSLLGEEFIVEDYKIVMRP